MESNQAHYHHVAVELNNIGVTLLESASYSFALETFRDAAELMKCIVRSKVDHLPPYICSDPLTQYLHVIEARNKLFSSRSVAEGRDALMRASTINKVANGKASMQAAVFTHAFRIQVNVEDENDEADYKRDAATVLYNMALAHHFHGQQKCIETSINKALSLYEMAYNVIVAGCEEQQTDDNLEMSIFLVMVLLNNMGVIYLGLDRHDLATVMFQRLSSIALEFPLGVNIWWTFISKTAVSSNDESTAPAA